MYIPKTLVAYKHLHTSFLISLEAIVSLFGKDRKLHALAATHNFLYVGKSEE